MSKLEKTIKDIEAFEKKNYTLYARNQKIKNGFKKGITISLITFFCSGVTYGLGFGIYKVAEGINSWINREHSVEYTTEKEISSVEIPAAEEEQTKETEELEEKVEKISDDYVIVQKGDSLWVLTKNYFRDKGVYLNNAQLTTAVNLIAVRNGKVRLGEYKSNMDASLNPSNLEVGQKIKIPDYLIEYYK